MIWVGTSGYNYPEWKGSFYPADLPASKMLAYYAARFPTVEINYTFYRMPTAALIAGWVEKFPAPYRLTLKAPRRITHDSRLRECGGLVQDFCGVARGLGEKAGALLFQLPPSLRKDLPRLEQFLQDVPGDVRTAFEFRHASWFDAEVLSLLKARGAGLCVADTADFSTAVQVTADHAYFRLRDEGYTRGDITRWAGIVAETAARCAEVFVYFKHEDEGKGPEFARHLLDDLARASVPGVAQ